MSNDRQFVNQFTSLSPLILTSTEEKAAEEDDNCGRDNKTTSISMNKFDPKDHELDTLLTNNALWAAAVTKEDPEFFSNIKNKQEPKLLWIGKS
jgi:hypothetical protein